MYNIYIKPLQKIKKYIYKTENTQIKNNIQELVSALKFNHQACTTKKFIYKSTATNQKLKSK